MPNTTVLLVDDDREVLESTAELLTDMGYSTVCARSGRDALTLLDAGFRPSLMLVDLEMPEMTGAELCAICHARPELAAVPRVLVSGSREPKGVVARGAALAFVSKPLGDRLLGELLKRYLRPS